MVEKPNPLRRHIFRVSLINRGLRHLNSEKKERTERFAERPVFGFNNK